MKIRDSQLTDKSEIDKIYKKFYSNNEYPDFFNTEEHSKFQRSFIISNDSDKIIVAGGIKTIAEAVFVTDRSLPAKIRLDALLQGLGASILITQGLGYQQIHAFVNNDERYVNTLMKFGFKLINAKLLVLDLGESNG